MLPQLSFRPDDLTANRVQALVQFHLDEMHANSPSCKIHALPPQKLLAGNVTFWTAWDGETLAGCGALKQVDDMHGELKSMRAATQFRGRGVGKAILLHLIEEAKQRGFRRLSLETGRHEFFRPAQALYEKHGFIECPGFGDYVPDDFSMCMTREL